MLYALIFAIGAGQPTVLEYRGNLNLPYDPSFGKVISFEDAERRIAKGDPPILFALVGGPVKRASEKQALALLKEWSEQRDARRQGKKTGKFRVPDPVIYKPRADVIDSRAK